MSSARTTTIDIRKIHSQLEPLGFKVASGPWEDRLFHLLELCAEKPSIPAFLFLFIIEGLRLLVHTLANQNIGEFFRPDSGNALIWLAEFSLPYMAFTGIATFYRRASADLNLKIVEGLTRGQEIQKVSILGFAKISEVRDPETGDHILRMSHYSRLLAQEAGKIPEYRYYVSPGYCEDIFLSAPLHDIGKVGIRDSILKKNKSLTADEFDIMKMHTIIGGDLLHELEMKLGYRTFYSMGKEIAYHHHQHYDGSGYPNVFGSTKAMFVEKGIGKPLKGKDIPLSARIVAIADVYDALRSRRCYKEPLPHGTVKDMMLAESGKHFDPELLNSFFRIEDKVLAIGREHKR